MKTSANISELQLLAASQWGLFSSAQAQGIGVGRTQISRMASAGRVESLTFGIYRFTSGETTSFADVKAAWMSIFPRELAFERLKKKTPDAIVTGRTAAYVHGIGDLYASPYTFIVQERKQTTRDDIKYLKWTVEEQDIEIIEGLPVATIERTIADLIRLKEDMSLVDDVVKDAIPKSESMDAGRLASLLKPLAARNGYPRHNGEAFARDIIERNSDYREEIAKALESVRSLYANNEALQEAIRKISEIASSSISHNLELPKMDVSGLVPAMPGLQLNMKNLLEPLQATMFSLDHLSLIPDISEHLIKLPNISHSQTIPRLLNSNSDIKHGKEPDTGENADEIQNSGST